MSVTKLTHNKCTDCSGVGKPKITDNKIQTISQYYMTVNKI